MRMVLLIPSLQAGGAERVLSLMANYWQSANNHVTIVTLAPEHEKPFYNLHCHVDYHALNQTMPSLSTLQAIVRNVKRIYAIRAVLKEIKPELVISFIDEMNILALLSSFGLHVPTIVSERIDPLHHKIGRIWQVLRRLLYALADIVVVQTNDVARFFSASLRRQIRIIPNPISTFTPTRQVVSPVDRDQYTLVAFGRLVDQKGFDLLVHAFAAIAWQHPLWSLTLWGEGERRPTLEALVEQHQLNGRVRIAGVTREPFTEMQSADLFVLSSRYEGFPNVLCEAMACGLPVVSFDCPSGPRDIIRNGVDGILVPPGDVAALAATLSRIMGDAAERARLASRAPEVIERFGVERVMMLWDTVIAELLPASVRHVPASDLNGEIVP